MVSAPAQVWRGNDSGRRQRTALCGCLALSALAGQASALESTPAPERDSPTSSWELRALGGTASVEWTNSGGGVMEKHAALLGLGARASLFLGSQLQLGASASVTHFMRVEQLDARDAQTFSDEAWAREASFTVWSPLGAFLELRPFANAGLFLNLSGSLGYLPLITSRTQSAMYLAGYSLEVGYESGRARPHAIGVFLRYGAWTGTESFLFTDSPAEIASSELTLGVRWTFRP